MAVLRSLPALLLLAHLVSAWNYGGGGGGWHDKIKTQLIVKHVPKHVNVYKHVPIPKPVPVPKPYGYLKPLAIAKPFKVPHVIPVIKHFQKPFPVIKGVPFQFPIPLPKLVKLPFQIKLPKPYVVHVPKPYAVAKKYPVAVPYHVPKPYIVPIYRPVPVGVPHKVPHIVPVVKEIPEYIKRPVPVYIEEKPMNHKGSPFPSGISKGSPFPSGISGGLSKGSPFPSGGLGKGSPFPQGISGGNKGTPYISSGKGGGSDFHSKGSTVHATSAAGFLAAHTGKLNGQNDGGYGSMLNSYGHDQGQSNVQGGQAYQDYGAGYGAGGGYDDIHGAGGFGNSVGYGRGAEGNKEGEDSSAAEEHGSYDSVRAHGGHLSSSKDEFAKRPADTKQVYPPKENSQAYIGVSVTSFNDHGGRGGGFHSDTGYSQNGGDHSQQPSLSYEGNSHFQSQQNEAGYANQENSGNYAQLPQVQVYQIQNGAATAINYPAPNVQIYDGYGNQNSYQPQEGEYGHNQVDNSGYEPKPYHQSDNSGYEPKPFHQSDEGNGYGAYGPQQNAFAEYNAYQGQEQSYQGHQSHHENQAYGSQQNQHAPDYAHQGESYGSHEAYGSEINSYTSPAPYSNQAQSQVYHNEASYQVNHGSNDYQSGGGEYNNQYVPPGLQQYGLQAAYAVQPSSEIPVQQGTGAVYVRAYDGRGDSPSAYPSASEEKYQTQDSQQQDRYSSYTKTGSSASAAESSQQFSAASQPAGDQLVGSSGPYSTPEGGDVKGGSWQGVPVQ